MTRRVLPASFRNAAFVAHRGVWGENARRLVDCPRGRSIPELSLTSVKLAGKLGGCAEIDLRATRDSLAVFHDSATRRMTRRDGNISALSEWELKQLTLAGSDEAVPSLHVMLKRVAEIGLMLDCKEFLLEQRLVRILDGFRNTAERVVVICNCVTRADLMRDYGPQYHRCLALKRQELFDQAVQTLRQNGDEELFDSVSIELGLATAENVQILKDFGLPMFGWRVRKLQQWQHCKELGLIPVTDYLPTDILSQSLPKVA